MMLRPSLQDPYAPVSEEAVSAFEGEIGYSLPGDYRSFLLATNGGVFHDEAITASGSAVDQLYGLDTGFDWCDLRAVRGRTVTWLPATLLEIASTPGGDAICLQLAGKRRGTVLAVDHEFTLGEMEPYELASSFAEFMDSLRLDEDFLLEEGPDSPEFRDVVLQGVEGAREQLRTGRPVDRLDQQRRTMLGYAAQYCRLNVLNFLLAGGADPNAQDGHMRPAMYYSVCSHSVDGIGILAEAGADVNAVGPEGSSLLMEASKRGSVRVAIKLLQMGADTGYRSPDGRDATSCCIGGGSKQYILPRLARS